MSRRVLVSLRRFEDEATVLEPTWSPDGATIAYTQLESGRGFFPRPTLRTVAAAGGASRVLIPDARFPAWSPDGSRLAFAGERDRNGSRCVDVDICSYAAELYVAAADGTGLTRLTNGEGDERDPEWSPDGSRILFTSDRNLPEGDSFEVYSIAADGSCLTWLTNGNPGSVFATWRPGSGVRYDPGSCDPNSRGALWEGPAPPRFRGGLWLGAGYRGLLLSDVGRWPGHVQLTYDDCERFEPRDCPRRIVVTSESACRRSAFGGLISNRYRFARRRGAVVALPSRQAHLRVISGDAVTTIRLGRSAVVSQVIRDLRPFTASGPVRRLSPSRVSRSFARRLESTTERRGRRLRELLRPYRFSPCG
jgi:WD40-like Beta Propeller Repeat